MVTRADAHRDEFHRGQTWKRAVDACTTGNVTISTALNAGDVVDGVTLAAGMRVLVPYQTAGSQNGIYDVGATPVRSYDMDEGLEARGALVLVVAGTVNGGKLFKNTNTGTVTIDSTALTFAEITPNRLILDLTNKSGGAIAAGDVVVIDTANDTAFTTTTTGQAERSVGIAQEAIASNAVGKVLVAGYAALVNVPASVTRGHYVETHTVAKQAVGNATRRSGSFGQFLTGGTTPTAILWGQTDQTASGGSLTDHTHAVTGSGATGGGGTLTPATFDFPAATSPAQTAEGRAVWDSDDDLLTIGDGASRKTFYPNVLTTQDDLVVAGASGVPGRLGKGSDGQVLTVDPTTHHLVWANATSGFTNPMTTKGDTIVGDTGGAAIRKAVGTDGQVFTADAASAGGIKWATPSGGSSDAITGQSGVGGAIITGLQGSSDIKVAATNDDEFDTTDTSDPMTGWTTLGSPTHDINSTRKSHYYLASSAASVALQGIYKAMTPAFTVTCKLNDYTITSTTAMRAGLMIAEASPGKLESISMSNNGALLVTAWTNRTTFGSNPGSFTLGYLPTYFRIVVHSSTNVDYQASIDGKIWTSILAARNPGFTVGAAGLFINPLGSLTEAEFDWVRFT